jgi:hypothetical protein
MDAFGALIGPLKIKICKIRQSEKNEFFPIGCQGMEILTEDHLIAEPIGDAVLSIAFPRPAGKKLRGN